MINFIFPSGWTLLGENVKCKDNDGLLLGYVPSLEECAIQCMGVSKWFIYAKSDNGNDKCRKLQGCCTSDGCQCACRYGSPIASGEGIECQIKSDEGYDLYELPDSAGKFKNRKLRYPSLIVQLQPLK